MKLIYSRKKDVIKLTVLLFFLTAICFWILNAVLGNILLFSLVVICFVVVFYFTINNYLQRIEFYEDRIRRVYFLSGEFVEIEYRFVEQAVVKHVYREGTQLILMSNQEKDGYKRKVQWDFNRRTDEQILNILREKGVKVVVE
ncbi:MAG: hypothetical protein JNK00_01520 [Flavipsychrobacter sp.]|nr:hypothetical protein [Flavipsychrobacter sp.]